jgi:hypothetical protein
MAKLQGKSARLSPLGRLFEAPDIGRKSLASRIVIYSILLAWSAYVIFPLYWVAVTSLKLPIDVNAGPVYLPFVDFEPSLHAWRDVFANDESAQTFRPYLNSIIVSLLSTGLCVLIGSMAAYVLARVEFRPRIGIIVLFVLAVVATAVAVGLWGVDWRLAATVALVLLILLALAFAQPGRAQAQITNLIATNEVGEPLDEGITTISETENLWAYVTSVSGGIVCVQRAPVSEDADCEGEGAWGGGAAPILFAGPIPVAPAPLKPDHLVPLAVFLAQQDVSTGVTGKCFDTMTWNIEHGLGGSKQWEDPEGIAVSENVALSGR